MKKYIRNAQELGEDIIIRDSIILDIEIPYVVASATRGWADNTKFPGEEQFRKDVLHILEDDYLFDVAEDDYNGILQKGWTSDRDDSDSIYFNTFYNLQNAADALKRADYHIDASNVSGKVYCYILFRVSDHQLDSQFSEEHKDSYQANLKKHTSNRDDILFHRDDTIYLDEAALQQHYQDALDELKYELDGRISAWVRIAKKYYTTE